MSEPEERFYLDNDCVDSINLLDHLFLHQRHPVSGEANRDGNVRCPVFACGSRA